MRTANLGFFSFYFVGLTQTTELVRTDFPRVENIEEAIKRYLGHLGPTHLQKFKNQAEMSGIAELLSIPIILLMACRLYKENKQLPRRTDPNWYELIE